MEYIPSATEIETLRNYLMELANPNSQVWQWRKEHKDPAIKAVVQAYKGLISHQVALKQSGELNDDLDYKYLAELKIEEIARYVADHPGTVERLVNVYEAKTKVAAKHELFNTKLGEMTGYQFREYLMALGFDVKKLDPNNM